MSVTLPPVLVEHLENAEHGEEQWNRAVASLARGHTVVVIVAHRSVLVCVAHTVDAAQMAFLIRHTSGFIQVALSENVCERLQLPEAAHNRGQQRPAATGQCVAVDAAEGTSTGISAADRARTARVLTDPTSTAADLTRPGHLVPTCVPSATGEHSGNEIAEIAHALSAAATAMPGAVFADLISERDPINLAEADEAHHFAERHSLTELTIAFHD